VQPDEQLKLREADKNTVEQVLNSILIRVVRPDKLNVFFENVVKSLLGEKFLEVPQLDLNKLVQQDTDPKTAILMCSAPGFDPSFKVEQLAKDTNSKLISVAIGSAEGFDQAEKSIEQATKQGLWVLLKNVHLAPTWLSEIEKKIYSKDKDKIHQRFKLFLAMEFNPKVPSTLVRMSYKLVFEPPNGMKASLQRTYGTVLSEKRTDKLPKERPHLHFLLAWTHAVIIERLRYIPIGWTKSYEFNEADQRCAIDLIDECIDQAAGDSLNISPEAIPWQAIKVILTQNIYGAKIDNEYDSKILVSLIEQYFNPRSFD
jgi:dynein heavy chain 1